MGPCPQKLSRSTFTKEQFLISNGFVKVARTVDYEPVPIKAIRE